MVFLRGVPYALTEVRGTLCSKVLMYPNYLGIYLFICLYYRIFLSDVTIISWCNLQEYVGMWMNPQNKLTQIVEERDS